MKVLIVEDRPENAFMLQRLLESQEHRVAMAPHGAEALKLLRHDTFDLIISDIMMPEMDGFQFCHAIKSDDRLQNIPFMFYTATYTDAKDEAFALSLGADAFVTKPIEHTELLRRIEEVMEQTRAGGTSVPTLSRADELKYLKEYNTRLIRKLEDKIEQVEEFNRSLEERVKEATAHLVSANQELDAFAYSVAHDLRAPLRAIEGMTQVLLEDCSSALSEHCQDVAQRIFSNVQRMDHLIRDLLDYSRLKSSELKLERVSLENVVEESLAKLAHEIKRAGAHLVVDRPLPEVVAHKTVLMQMFTNLLENALKYVSRGVAPSIHVSATAENGKVTLRVQDNGPGIPPEYRERIFNVFERLPSPEALPGTGIGLAIVKKGAERLGGRAGVTSVNGHGSTFWIELPAAA